MSPRYVSVWLGQISVIMPLLALIDSANQGKPRKSIGNPGVAPGVMGPPFFSLAKAYNAVHYFARMRPSWPGWGKLIPLPGPPTPGRPAGKGMNLDPFSDPFKTGLGQSSASDIFSTNLRRGGGSRRPAKPAGNADPDAAEPVGSSNPMCWRTPPSTSTAASSIRAMPPG